MSSSGSRSYALEICLLIPMAIILFVAEYRAFSAPVQNMKRSLKANPVIFVQKAANPQSNELLQHQVVEPAKKVSLPLLHKTGGLAIFLHVAKTGGTTIRETFSNETNFPNVDVRRLYGVNKIKIMKSMIDWHVSEENTEKKIMLLEMHGGHGNPVTVFDIHEFIQTWRQKAEASNKQVFVFTLLREPTHFFVSYFNFFKHPDCSFRWCDRPLMQPTEENLLASMVPNMQCLYLVRKWNKDYNAAHPVTHADCQSAYDLLQANADWVGTTDTMQETTLPLLSFILTGQAETAQTLQPQNQQKSKQQSALSVEDLSDRALQTIAAKSTLDQFLYERAQNDYRLDMFDNNFATTGTA